MPGVVAIALAACAPTVPDAPDTTNTQPTTTEPGMPETTVAETTTTRPTTTEPDTTKTTVVETTTTRPTTTEPEVPVAHPEVVELDFSFETDADGWVVGFADLPEDYDQSIFELDGGHRALPDGLDGSGIYLQGHNRSDDLFMYVKRQIEGLVSGASYTVSATVDLATNAPLDSIGIGGSPGQSVYVKAGASTTEPDAVPDSTGHLRMRIDKGNQSRGGTQMAVLGVVGHPDIVGDEFRRKTLDSMDGPVVVAADAAGRVWLIVGTDSGFEGLTRLYYDRISFTLTPIEPA
ncbi:MAG: PEP-CTERM sorting domain-containing protein [Acidimicrobiia bacterium]|nr:PEP-CTERM sorting domain-containing protein [Acidimicrobiia bacterium]